MFAISNAELYDLPPAETVNCSNCGGTHPVERAEKIRADGTREICYMLGFYRCGDKSYLYSIRDRDIRKDGLAPVTEPSPAKARA
jgi:hypothetical protein